MGSLWAATEKRVLAPHLRQLKQLLHIGTRPMTDEAVIRPKQFSLRLIFFAGRRHWPVVCTDNSAAGITQSGPSVRIRDTTGNSNGRRVRPCSRREMADILGRPRTGGQFEICETHMHQF